MTFTNISSQQSTDGTTESATFTIGAPSETYEGPEEVEVYFDTIYRTFAFKTVYWAGQGAQGIVRDANGHVLGSAEVSIRAGGQTFSTVTDSYGRFRILGEIKGPATLTTSGLSKHLTPEELTSPIEVKTQE